MIDTLYIEEEVKDHPRVKNIEKKFPLARKIFCEKFSEIFNRNAQSFRLQKQKPALILAKKYGNFLHPLPSKNGIGLSENFYFSPLLNCPFDCSYCFLQGFYRSAHFVYFVNIEDFAHAIEDLLKKNPSLCFFCGYDSDSLALEPISSFLLDFFPFFQNYPKALFELRSKSASIELFSHQIPIDNLVIAFSLNPQKILENFEKKAPSLEKRLNALQNLQEKGWKTALRFDPIIDHKNFEESYKAFFQEVFSTISPLLIHSATLGALRFPKTVYENIKKISKSNPLLAKLTPTSSHLVSYERENELLSFCKKELLLYIPEEKIFIDSVSSLP